MSDNLFALFEHRIEHPQRPFLVEAGQAAWSFQDMLDATARIANLLTARGVQPGDRVAAQVDKSPEAVMLYLGCLRAGAVYLPLNTAYTHAELDYFLGDARPAMFVCRSRELGSARVLAARHAIAHVETMDARGGGTLATAQAGHGTAHATVSRSADDLAAILYTSGTTGRSKGAMISHRNLASNALALAEAWRFDRTDVLLHALPIFHVHGLFVAINVPLLTGATLLFVPRFDAAEVIRLLPRATVMMGVPTFYVRLLEEPALTRSVVARARLFVAGSAPLSAQTHAQWAERTGHLILERYGMTETGMNTSNPYEGERIAGSVGLPLPGVEVRIVDRETGASLATGEIGVIEVSGPNVCKGYWRMPDRTQAEFRSDGFFITGDVGYVDERGYVYIVGRAKDLVITGGYNVYPREVEGEIDRVPGVAESAVIGVPHPDYGEGVTAVVVAKGGTLLDERAVLRELEVRLAKYKLPKRVVFVADLPRNAMGKVEKKILRERYAHLYAPDAQRTV